MHVVCIHTYVQVSMPVYTQRPEKTLDQNSIPLNQNSITDPGTSLAVSKPQ